MTHEVSMNWTGSIFLIAKGVSYRVNDESEQQSNTNQTAIKHQSNSYQTTIKQPSNDDQTAIKQRSNGI